MHMMASKFIDLKIEQCYSCHDRSHMGTPEGVIKWAFDLMYFKYLKKLKNNS